MSDHNDQLNVEPQIDEIHNAPLLGHGFDGIQECDNPPPGWLMLLFYATIAFSMVYVPYYIMGYAFNFDYPNIWVANDIKAHEPPPTPTPEPDASPVAVVERTEDDLKALVADKGNIDAGKPIYALRCAACHAAEGQGLIGPNLTDNAWIHGASLLEVEKVIHKGVLDKGMPNWDSQLKPHELDKVLAYVTSLRGTNPPNPKAPQGTVVEATP